jgi:hypothetical protein
VQWSGLNCCWPRGGIRILIKEFVLIIVDFINRRLTATMRGFSGIGRLSTGGGLRSWRLRV